MRANAMAMRMTPRQLKLGSFPRGGFSFCELRSGWAMRLKARFCQAENANMISWQCNERRSEVRGRRSEVGGQRSEVGGQKSAADLRPLISDLWLHCGSPLRAVI